MDNSVTDVDGFIDFRTAFRLVSQGYRVVGFDYITSYYKVPLKGDRLRNLEAHTGFTSVQVHFVKRTPFGCR